MIPVGIAGILDVALHIIFASIAMIILVWGREENFDPLKIIAFAFLMEIVIDGAHLVNKDYTHNIFFLLELPLLFLFIGFMDGNAKLEKFSLLLLANNWTHLVMDLFYEGDALHLYYPVSNITVDACGAGFVPGLLLWILLLLPIWLSARKLDITQPLSPPPYPT